MSDGLTLTQHVSHLRLAEDAPLSATFPPKFERIELHVDLLEIEGRVSLPGRTLDIQARRILVTGDGPAILDVSGSPPATSFDPGGSDAAPDGTAGSPAGVQGQDGSSGEDAGDVKVVAYEILGELTVLANGSDGGHGQRGGNGARPARPDGADAAWTDKNKPESGSKDGGGKLQGGTWWVAWAAGAPGRAAIPGGNAGAGGKPGAGGNAGRIRISSVGATSNISTQAEGGASGQVPTQAQAGPPSAPGHGGRNRLYYQEYSIIGTKMSGHGDSWVGTKSGEFPYYKNKYKLANNNKNSTTTAAPGTVPPPPQPALGGMSFEPVVTTATVSELAGDFDIALIELSLTRAHRGADTNPDLALQRYNWVIDLTGYRESDDLRALHDDAVTQVMCRWPMDRTKPLETRSDHR